MNRQQQILWAKVKATFTFILFSPCIMYYRGKAWGDKKSFCTIWRELFVMIWRDHAYHSVAEWGAKLFIRDYFVQRVYLKSSALDDYVSDVPGILIMKFSSARAIKRIRLLDNKESFWNYMVQRGFPLTKRLGYLNKTRDEVRWVREGEEPSTLDELLRLHGSVFVKPADAMQGTNCALLEPADTPGGICVNHVEMSRPAFISWVQGDLLIEEVVKQHPQLAAFHPQSLNTIRMVTMQRENGEIYLELAVQRLGVGEMRVDNFSKGGIAVPIGKDGTLTPTGCRKDFALPGATEHPDSHITFAGYAIPYYEQAVDMVIRAHRLHKGLNGVGWDVAITENGPLMIEANPFFDFDIMQATTHGYRKLLWQSYLPQALKFAPLYDVLL